MALSIDRLEHYTGTSVEMFQRYVLFTNYEWHVEEFRAALPGCVGPDRPGRQMPAWHHVLRGNTGVSMVNIGVGPSNASSTPAACPPRDSAHPTSHCSGSRSGSGNHCSAPPPAPSALVPLRFISHGSRLNACAGVPLQASCTSWTPLLVDGASRHRPELSAAKV
jgi:hypothetical protein